MTRSTVSSIVSRRTFVLALGGGLAAAASVVWGLRTLPAHSALSATTPQLSDACCGSTSVHYQGWVLTAADKEAIRPQLQVRQLENIDIAGGDINSRTVAGADACAAWCLTDDNCRAFTYAKPTHPDVNKRNRCWIKTSSRPSAVADPFYTSGVLEPLPQ